MAKKKAYLVMPRTTAIMQSGLKTAKGTLKFKKGKTHMMIGDEALAKEIDTEHGLKGDLAPAEGDGGRTARDVSAAVRSDGPPGPSPDNPSGRVVTVHGGTYLLPTVVRCDADHALANREFLFPYASVVEVPAEQLPDCLGSSLVVTCISNDPAFQARFVASSHVDRLNIGPIPTTQIGWDQPHEGNQFEHLYARRAYQRPA